MSDTPSNPFLVPTLPALASSLTPEARATIVGQVQSMRDDDVSFMLDVLETHPAGRRAKYVRLGIGAAIGLAVGVVACKVL